MIVKNYCHNPLILLDSYGKSDVPVSPKLVSQAKADRV